MTEREVEAMGLALAGVLRQYERTDKAVAVMGDETPETLIRLCVVLATVLEELGGVTRIDALQGNDPTSYVDPVPQTFGPYIENFGKRLADAAEAEACPVCTDQDDHVLTQGTGCAECDWTGIELTDAAVNTVPADSVSDGERIDVTREEANEPCPCCSDGYRSSGCKACDWTGLVLPYAAPPIRIM